MKWISLLQTVILLTQGIAQATAQAPERGERNSFQSSIVVLEVARKQFDYLQPWTRRIKTTQKVGLVVGDNEILTTAEDLFDRTLIRMQKNGRGKWWIGELRWIDYHANLAMVKAVEAGFTSDLQRMKWAGPEAVDAPLVVARWREGHLEVRKADVNQVTVDTGRLTFAPYVQFEVSTEIQGIGEGEPLLSPAGAVGIVTAQNGNNCIATPASFITPILEAQRKGIYRGLGFFDFYWQPSENPANLAHLKLDGEPRGVLISEVPTIYGTSEILKPRDIILKVDGFDIDIQGDYLDPDYDHLSLENLATRGKWAGDDVKLTVWRDGKSVDVTYRLPKAEYSSTLVPDAVYDKEPEFLVVGGLVFQPLNDPYLQSWGADWKRRAPFRLYYYNNEEPTKERPALVILSQVLPDAYNIGYQELKYLVLDEVNGKKISRLTDLQEALDNPSNGFHRFLFMRSDSLRRLVLSADDCQAATARVLKRYGIPADSYIAPAPAAGIRRDVAESK